MKPLPQASPYSTSKLLHHPEALEALRLRRHQNPTVIHLMPALACNQRCGFCSYGHRLPDDGPEQYGWKNMELMTEDYLPRLKMLDLCADFHSMGVKAIELTGGGEPLIWPHVDEFFRISAKMPWDMALVTNGTALTEDRANLFSATSWKWARVSIDAGTLDQYVATRRVSHRHWAKAWRAVRLLADRKDSPEQRVGVGYVVDRTNAEGVYSCLARARDTGADNVRVSMAFTPQGQDRLGGGVVDRVRSQLDQARTNLEGPDFQINALFDERLDNLLAPAQDYRLCAMKEVLCVVGGDQRVYTCCSLAFNPLGLIGSIEDQSFESLWWSEDTISWFEQHDARVFCRVPCLYEKRNKTALRLMAEDVERGPRPPHVNYL